MNQDALEESFLVATGEDSLTAVGGWTTGRRGRRIEDWSETDVGDLREDVAWSCGERLARALCGERAVAPRRSIGPARPPPFCLTLATRCAVVLQRAHPLHPSGSRAPASPVLS